MAILDFLNYWNLAGIGRFAPFEFAFRPETFALFERGQFRCQRLVIRARQCQTADNQITLARAAFVTDQIEFHFPMIIIRSATAEFDLRRPSGDLRRPFSDLRRLADELRRASGVLATLKTGLRRPFVHLRRPLDDLRRQLLEQKVL